MNIKIDNKEIGFREKTVTLADAITDSNGDCFASLMFMFESLTDILYKKKVINNNDVKEMLFLTNLDIASSTKIDVEVE